MANVVGVNVDFFCDSQKCHVSGLKVDVEFFGILFLNYSKLT